MGIILDEAQIGNSGIHVIENCIIEVAEGHEGSIFEISSEVSGVRIANNMIKVIPKGQRPALQPTVINFDAYCTLPPTILLVVILVIRWICRVINRGRRLVSRHREVKE